MSDPIADIAEAAARLRRSRMHVARGAYEERMRAVIDLAHRTGQLYVAPDVALTAEQRADLASVGIAVVVHPLLEAGTMMACAPREGA